MRASAGIVFLVAGLVGCGGNEAAESKKTAEANGKQQAAQVAGSRPAEVSASGTQTHANGLVRFKDPGVYADGKLIGMLQFGELPAPLDVYWFEDEAGLEFGPNSKGPKTEIVRQRRYSFSKYFAALGLDVDKIKEVHIYGAQKRRTAAVVVSGDEMREYLGFSFRFGNDVFGKPIPACPDGIGDGKCPDSLGAVAVYLERPAPERRGGYFYLDGNEVDGIPYYGQPLRGGVRIYLDGPHVATVKRKYLRGKGGKVRDDGVTEWKLFTFLESKGVDTSKIADAWIVQKDRWTKRLTRKELVDATFIAKPGKSGEIFLGADEISVNHLQLFTRVLRDDELPKVEDFELYNYE
jgi:hypothetical protein